MTYKWSNFNYGNNQNYNNNGDYSQSNYANGGFEQGNDAYSSGQQDNGYYNQNSNSYNNNSGFNSNYYSQQNGYTANNSQPVAGQQYTAEYGSHGNNNQNNNNYFQGSYSFLGNNNNTANNEEDTSFGQRGGFMSSLQSNGNGQFVSGGFQQGLSQQPQQYAQNQQPLNNTNMPMGGGSAIFKNHFTSTSNNGATNDTKQAPKAYPSRVDFGSLFAPSERLNTTGDDEDMRFANRGRSFNSSYGSQNNEYESNGRRPSRYLNKGYGSVNRRRRSSSQQQNDGYGSNNRYSSSRRPSSSSSYGASSSRRTSSARLGSRSSSLSYGSRGGYSSQGSSLGSSTRSRSRVGGGRTPARALSGYRRRTY